jgi:MSHA pilin protein MshD
MSARTARGFTLVEMIIAIVVVSVGIAGVLAAFSTTVKSSGDPMVRKQMLAVAEEMMEEILLKPYAVSGVVPVNTTVGCGVAGAIRTAFDDVSDYHDYRTSSVCDIEGILVPGLASYAVQVSVTAASLGTPAAAAAKRISVTVTTSGESLTLVGWRTDYAS